jgi:hypothetical protein
MKNLRYGAEYGFQLRDVLWLSSRDRQAFWQKKASQTAMPNAELTK